MNIAQAASLLGDTTGMYRTSWAGGIFVFRRPPDELSIDVIVHTVKSLPAVVKRYMATTYGNEPAKKIRFTVYLCRKTQYDDIENGWHPSNEDLLAADWELFQLNTD